MYCLDNHATNEVVYLYPFSHFDSTSMLSFAMTSAKSSAGKLSAVCLAGILLASLGAGCQAPKLPSLSPTSTQTSGTAADQVTAKLQLQPGDSFDIDQTFLGIGGVVSKVADSIEGTRTVQITDFVPMKSANVSWQKVIERETDASRKARADAEALRLKGGASATTTVPDPVIQRVVTTGTVTQIDLHAPHELYLPTYWKDGDNRLLQDKSAIWLSDDAFQELTRTNKTELDYGYLASGASAIVKNISALNASLSKLRNAATDVGKTQDPLLLEVVSTNEEMPLLVNGKQVNVSVIRARNWFGEVTILNNRQNPLVLKMTYNPLVTGAAELLGNDKGLQTLFGYQINAINIAAF